MAKSLLTGIDLITDLINAGSLVDPITSRSGDYAFSDNLRLSGQFPKVYVTGEIPDEDDSYTFGDTPESMTYPSITIYYFVKLSRENIFTDSAGSYKNERLVMRFQQLIKEMLTVNLNKFKALGLSNIRIKAAPKVIPNKEAALFAGHVTLSFMWRNI